MVKINKVLFLIIITFIFILNPEAETNRLYLSSSNNELYYDTSEFDDHLFMYHVDMIPGKVYQDELLIENDSNTSYSLYLRINEDNIDDNAKELLDNIIMTIYLDDKILYEGFARGVSYVQHNQFIKDSIFIGNYDNKDRSLLTVETKLSPSYSNIENTSLAELNWQFIATDIHNQTVINPNTKDNINRVLKLLGLAFCILVYILYRIRDKEPEVLTTRANSI